MNAYQLPMRLVDTVLVRETDGELVLTNGVEYALRVKGPPAWLAIVRRRLTEGVCRGDLGSDHGLQRLVAELDSLRWLTSEHRESPTDGRLVRQRGYLSLFGPNAGDMQERISRATVALVGVGGIGSLVAENVAAAGVGRIIAIDPDNVELHNLNRQLAYSVDDIGSPKADALRRRIARLAQETTVIPVVDRIVDDCHVLAQVPGRVDLVALCADEPAELASVVWRWCADRHVGMTRAAVGHERGYWGPLLLAGRHCIKCFEERRVNELSESSRQLERCFVSPTPWSFGATNSIIAAWLAHDVLEFLMTGSCATLNRRAQLNLAAGKLYYFDGGPCVCTGRGSAIAAGTPHE